MMISQRGVKAALVLCSLVAAQAHAALIDCPPSFTTDPAAKIENATGTSAAASACQYLNTADNNNVARVVNINAAGFFGHTDWVANAGNLQMNRGGASGTWAISDADFAANDYMIVFKSGAGTNLMGFLLNELYTSGVWSTPFTSSAFAFKGKVTARDVSHYTIMQRANVLPPEVQLPEPGMLGLLGIGLAGYAATRRRSLKK